MTITALLLEDSAEGLESHSILGKCTTNMFLLDFGRCHEAELDEKGVKTRIRHFLSNDPYYPRPHSGNAKDEECWKAFKDESLSSSRAILDSPDHQYPELVIRLIEKMVEEAVANYKKW